MTLEEKKTHLGASRAWSAAIVITAARPHLFSDFNSLFQMLQSIEFLFLPFVSPRLQNSHLLTSWVFYLGFETLKKFLGLSMDKHELKPLIYKAREQSRKIGVNIEHFIIL